MRYMPHAPSFPIRQEVWRHEENRFVPDSAAFAASACYKWLGRE